MAATNKTKKHWEGGSSALKYFMAILVMSAAIYGAQTANAATPEKPMLEIKSTAVNGAYELVLNEATPKINTLQIALNGHVSGDFAVSLPTADWTLIGGGKSITDARTTFAIGNVEAEGLSYPAGKIATIIAATPLTIAYDGTSHTTMELATTVGYSTLLFGVELSDTDVKLFTGDKYQLTPKFLPENATDKKLTWTSNSPETASVDQAGTVLANKDGSAIITATTNDGSHSASCSVTVSTKAIPVTGVELSPRTLALKVGAESQLSAIISPASATNKSVSWLSSNSTVASVSNNGLVTAHAVGAAILSVTTEDGSHTDDCAVTVTSADADVPVPDDPTANLPIRPIKPNLPPDSPADVSPAKQQVSFVSPETGTEEDKAAALNKTAEGMVYVRSSDLTLDAMGYVVGTNQFIVDAAGAGGVAINSKDILPLPVITANVPKGGVVAVGFAIEGGSLRADTAEKIRILGVRCDRTGRLFDYAFNASDFSDRKFAIFDSWDRTVSGKINKYDDYKLVLFIKDGGLFDLDGKENGSVSCIFSVLDAGADPGDTPTPTPSGGGGGGCNAGFGILPMLAALPLLKKKR